MKSAYIEALGFRNVQGQIADWMLRHRDAIEKPRNGFELAMLHLVEGWLRYADAYGERFESGIGEDYVLGVFWSQIGASLRGLLNGDCGRFDCGTLDGLLSDTLRAEGFDPDLM